MKVSLVLLSIVLAMVFATPAKERIPDLNEKGELGLTLQEKVRQGQRCRLSICFAFDGSGSTSEIEFQEQKNFIIDTAAVTIGSVGEGDLLLAGVQYGISVQPVSTLTSAFQEFFLQVDRASHLRGERTNIAASIYYCAQELSERNGDAKQIVLLTDGRANIGEDPAVAANVFREDFGGEIDVVGLRFVDEAELLRIVGGKEDNVFSIDDGISAVLAVSDKLVQLFEEKCG